jgi:hypothetical protein
MTIEAQIGHETTSDIRKSLSRRALEYARYGYESSCQDWRDLETKLRGLAGISGIFIGGIAALAGNHRIGELARIPLLALCVALASVSLAAAYKLCGTAMVTAVTGALATRTACLGLATTARTSCLMGCKSALESCISQAMATCANEVAACTSGGGGG